MAVLEARGRILAPLMGWYHGRPLSSKLGMPGWARATEVKGKWRWWMRAAVAPFFPDKTLKELDLRISQIMGSTSQPSLFTVRFKVSGMERALKFHMELQDALRKTRNDREVRRIISRNEEYRHIYSIPRIKILLLKKREETFEEYRSRVIEILSMLRASPFDFTITVTSKREGDDVNFALDVLALFLAMDGVGAISNRGFGSMVVREISPTRYSRFFRDPRRLGELVKIILEAGSRLYGRSPVREPLSVPSLGNLNHHLSERSWRSEFDALREVGNATLRGNLVRYSRNRSIHTWVLGLPRFRSGGYKIDSEKGRRQSSISFKLVGDGPYRILVKGMYSTDWELRKITHYPRGVVVNRNGYRTYVAVWEAITQMLGVGI